MHFQPRKQMGRRGRVAGAADVGGGVRLDGGIGADGAQHPGQFRLVPVGQQLFALFGLDSLVLNVFVHTVQAAEPLYQSQRGLFANARHAGNIVRRIAHQALDVDELGRFHAVFFPDGVLVHGQSFFVGGQQHRGSGADQLQAVPVAGGQQCNTARSPVGGGQRAQKIVGLPARAAYLRKAQVVQQFFQHRHLLGQFLGHSVAGGFVAVVGLVAEGGCALVPGNGHSVGAVGSQQVEQNVLKPKDGVGVPSVLGGKQLDAEKGPVDQTVAVQDHQFHSEPPAVEIRRNTRDRRHGGSQLSSVQLPFQYTIFSSNVVQ